MGNIVLLDDLTINKIAAGEVIERPASVVKELVENSIDAGSTNINVEIKNGGISYIRVTDNGKGIMQDDMEIAFERHATSKIRQADDLEKVKSMGFRGEALASIAAIAKVDMKSKTQESDVGYKVVVEGGNILESMETGCPNGTTITIENLFFNTPVRYKFLKKDFTEAGYIEDIMTRIALVHPEIAVKLISSGKTVIQTTGNGNIKDVIYSIYGKETAENILDVDYTYEDIKVTGVVGKPSLSRSNRANQIFFVNKRYVKDKTLTASSEQAFKGMITIGKFGFVILNLEMDPQKVDVNVHPAKLEVRFEEESKVFKAVFHAIKETLLKGDLVSNPEREYDEKSETAETFKKVETENSNAGLFGGLFKNRKLEDEDKEETEEKSDKIETDSDTTYVNSDIKFDKDNIIEQLYRQKSAAKTNNIATTATYDSIISKMAEMKKNVDEFKNNGTAVAEEQEQYDNNEINQNIENNSEMHEENNQPEINDEQEQAQQTDENVENIENIEETQQIETVNNIEETQEINNDIGIKNQIINQIGNEHTQILKTIPDIEKTQVIDMRDVIEKTKELDEVRMEHGEQFDEMYTSVFGRMPVKEEVEEEKPESALDNAKIIEGEEFSIFEDEKNKKYTPQYRFIGIAFKTYIIIELNDEVYIIDQHAAHERIMYESVKENYYNEDIKDSQLMLLPDIITLTHKEMDIARENMDMFRKAGFTLDEFGDNTIKLTGVPNICIDLDTKELFLETLDEINTVARTAKQEKEEKFIATVACKAAVKAHMALTKEEVDSLMDKLLKLPNPFTCPHGRPTAIRMSKNDIERKFSRR